MLDQISLFNLHIHSKIVLDSSVNIAYVFRDHKASRVTQDQADQLDQQDSAVNPDLKVKPVYEVNLVWQVPRGHRVQMVSGERLVQSGHKDHKDRRARLGSVVNLASRVQPVHRESMVNPEHRELAVRHVYIIFLLIN